MLSPETRSAKYSLYLPSSDEMRQSDDEGADGHQNTTHCNDLWPMEFGPKVTDEGNHQQVTWGTEAATVLKVTHLSSIIKEQTKATHNHVSCK